jgi:phosphoglycerate dehydrogenase-like enzyme
MEKIVVVLPVTATQKARLTAAAAGREICFCTEETVSLQLLSGATVVMGQVAPSLVTRVPTLRWMQLAYAGADGYTDPGVLPPGAVLTNATGAYGLALSEHLLACLLMLIKKLHRYYPNQQAHAWRDEGTVTSIYGAKTLVVGCGDIGCAFAERMHGLGSRVWGIRRHPGPAPAYLEGMYGMEMLKTLLPEMDIVAAALPDTRETRKLFDRAFFQGMRPGAYFLNIGRGSAVDTEALADALYGGHLGGAAVDVTDPEPLPEAHRLWEAPNLILTPHVSGQFHLPETLNRIVEIAAENLERYLRGEPLKNVVDFATGYRRYEGR